MVGESSLMAEVFEPPDSILYVAMTDAPSEDCVVHFQIDGISITHLVPTTHIPILYEDEAFRLRYIQQIKDMHTDLFNSSTENAQYQDYQSDPALGDSSDTLPMCDEAQCDTVSEPIPENSSETCAAGDLTTQNTLPTKVWVPNKKPTDVDHRATVHFLDLRHAHQYSKRFDDKKSIKLQIWKDIAFEMFKAGYDVGIGKDGAEKCRQKFQNLQKSYMDYKKHVNSTGKESKAPPAHYEALDAILGDKHKTVPPLLLDSLCQISDEMVHVPDSSPEDTRIQNGACQKGHVADKNASAITIGNETGEKKERVDSNITESHKQTTETQKLTKNRYSTIKSSTRPIPKRSSDESIEKIHNANVKHHESIESLLKDHNEQLAKQNMQRERLITLFESLVQPKQKKKRKHSSDSSE